MLDCQLGEAYTPILSAVVTEAGSINAQNVASTLWAFAKLECQLGDAYVHGSSHNIPIFFCWQNSCYSYVTLPYNHISLQVETAHNFYHRITLS